MSKVKNRGGGHSAPEGHVAPNEAPAPEQTSGETDPYATDEANVTPPEDTFDALLKRLADKPDKRDQDAARAKLGELKDGFAESARNVIAAKAGLKLAEDEQTRAGQPIAQLVRALNGKKVEIDGEMYFPAVDNVTKILGLRHVRGGADVL